MRRLRFRYTLRTLVALFFCVGAVMGWLARQHRQIQRERAALVEIRDIQAKMTAPTAPMDAWIKDPLDVESVQLPWWLAWDGDRDFERVIGVGFTFGWYDEQMDPETEISDREMRLIADCPNIKRLEIPHSEVGDAGLAHLASLEYLEKLDLSATKITDRGLRHLAQMRGLKELKLNHMDLSGAGIQHLARCPRLGSLEVYQRSISSDYVDHFNRISSLELLRLAASRFERFRLHGLRRFRGLSLHGRDCTAFEFTDLPALKSLEISCKRIDRLVLRNLPRLTKLSIYAESVSGEAVECIGDVPSLRRLCVSGSSVSNAGLKAISRLSSLEELFLGSTTVDDHAMDAFGGLRRLKKLSLHAPAVTVQGLDHLRHLRSLEKLTLIGIRGTGNFTSVLSGLPHLRELRLEDCQFRELRCAGHKNLENIEGDCTELDAIYLEGLPKLRRIDLSRLHVQQFSFERLPRLAWLHLSILQGPEVTSARLRELPRLEHLGFFGITPEGGIEGLQSPVRMPGDVFDHFDTYPRLRRLDTSGMYFPDQAQRKLVEFRKRGTGR